MHPVTETGPASLRGSSGVNSISLHRLRSLLRPVCVCTFLKYSFTGTAMSKYLLPYNLYETTTMWSQTLNRPTMTGLPSKACFDTSTVAHGQVPKTRDLTWSVPMVAAVASIVSLLDFRLYNSRQMIVQKKNYILQPQTCWFYQGLITNKIQQVN